MDEFQVTLKGESYAISRDMVISAMADKEPANIQTYAVDVEGRTFPVKQVLAETLHVPRAAFISTRANAILSKLGFRVWDVTRVPSVADSSDSVRREARAQALAMAIRFTGPGSGSKTEEVLRVASDFDRWLGGG